MRTKPAIFLSLVLTAAIPHAGFAEPKITPNVPGTLKNRPTVSFAGTTLQCGDKNYHVTTGTKTGSCSNIMSPDGLKKIGVACKDTQGNYSGASCTEGCLNSTGAGDCTIP